MGVYAMYLWSINTSHKNIGVLTRLGHDRATDMCRSFINAYVEFFIRSLASLGGSGIICQIDESLYVHKQNYHRGRTSEHQAWVLGQLMQGLCRQGDTWRLQPEETKLPFLILSEEYTCLVRLFIQINGLQGILQAQVFNIIQ